jgi:hypothetical protein
VKKVKSRRKERARIDKKYEGKRKIESKLKKDRR